MSKKILGLVVVLGWSSAALGQTARPTQRGAKRRQTIDLYGVNYI